MMLEMNTLFDFAILSFASLFAIVDPVGLIPAFLAMTEGNTIPERIRMVRLASAITFAILVASLLVGQTLLQAFGISLPAFEIAGGIILLLVALEMLQAKRPAIKETPEEKNAGITKEDVAITPMAIPMLAGPGAITAVILLKNKAESLAYHFVLFGNIVLVSALTFLILWIVAAKSKSLSIIAIKIIARLMGLILAAIAVQFILNGAFSAGILPFK